MTTLEKVLEAIDRLNYTADGREYRRIARQFNLKMSYGETRFCLVFPDDDFVLKMPRFDNTPRDYCALEVENYQKGVEYRIERVLLKIELIHTTPNGIPIYKQAKFTYPTCEMPWLDREKMVKAQHVNKAVARKALRCCLDYDRISSLWFNQVYSLYGKKFLRSFEQWTHDCKVNDLHGNNTGFVGKLPILLDFAGYHEWDNSESF